MKSIYVGNLPSDITEDKLRMLFEQYGTVHSVNLIRSRKTGQLRGFGFVEMDEGEANAAIAALNRKKFEGRKLRVNEARPQRESSQVNETQPYRDPSRPGTLAWLHISDLYFRATDAYDSARVLKTLLEDVRKQISESLRPDFIAVTGDVAFSGQWNEYAVACEFFDDLLSITGLSKDRLFVVPGNHDIDWSQIDPIIARGVSASLVDTDQVNQFLSSTQDRSYVFRKFHAYARFVNEYFGEALTFSDEDYYYSRFLEINGRRVAIAGLNSTWMSGYMRDDTGNVRDLGHLLIGKQQLTEALAGTEQADLCIALLHHPLNWLQEFDRKECESLLYRSCDFILHSQHYRPYLIFEQPPNTKTTILAASVSDLSREYPGTYNLVNLDLMTRKGQVFLRTYSDLGGGFWATDTISFPNAPNGIYTFSLRPDWSPPSEVLPVSVSAPDRVYLKELHLRNFRCFKDQALRLSKEFTVFIGDNGLGKTAILEALSIGVGAFLLGLDGFRGPLIVHDQARLVHYRYDETTTYESQYPVQISCESIWGSRELRWEHVREGERESGTAQNIQDIADLATRLQELVRRGRDAVLPLIAYYSTGRLWRAPDRKPREIDKPGSRFRGYENCLDPASHIGGLMQWMKTQELTALQESKSNSVYEAVKEAIKSCVEDVRRVYYNIQEDDIFVCFSREQELPFRMLSEGVRNMLAMVADIAYRAVLLNPQFAEKAAEMTPGIVLIDELDLHLHPKWQQKVVADLGRTFPQMQFIATTHSPLIIGGLPLERVVLLQRDEKDPSRIVVVPMEESLQGWRADQILTSLAFGLESSRDPETQKLIRIYSELVVQDEDELSQHEQDRLDQAARVLQLRLPTSAERQEAREAYEMIQRALLTQWEQKPSEEKQKLLLEVQAQLLETIIGSWRPG